MRLTKSILTIVALLFVSAPAYAANVPLLTGPQPGADLVSVVNGTIVSVNSNLAPGGAGSVASALTIPTVASAVNGVQITPGATGTAPIIAASGGAAPDTNVALALAGNGTGLVTLGGNCTVTGTTPQTCNGQTGVVTTGTLTTAAATAATYTINNSSIAATSVCHASLLAYSGTFVTNGYPIIGQANPGSGTLTLTLVNTHAANALNGTLKIAFTCTH